MAAMAVRPAVVADHAEVLAWLGRHAGVVDPRGFAAEALHLLRRDPAAGQALFGAWQGTKLVGAAWVAPMPGAVALVWPPCGTADEAAVAELWIHIESALRTLRVKLAQIVLPSVDASAAATMKSHGFAPLTTLIYLRRSLERVPRTSPKGLTFIPTTRDEPALAALLPRTYEGSLDCPELDGVRTIDEVLAGHAGDPAGNESHWWIIKTNHGEIGVALVNGDRTVPLWDLVYLGLVPPARGQGLGRLILGWLLEQAQAGGARLMTVAVDCRNTIARRLYDQLGFEEFDQRQVWWRALSGPPA